MGQTVFSGHQPNFLPYMGYFYKMLKSDIFVFDDDVQYEKRSYTNSNYIKVNDSRHKITVPVSTTLGDKINEVKINYDRDWTKKMLDTVGMNYRRATYVDAAYEFLERHLKAGYELLVDLNMHILYELIERFGIKTKLVIASKDVPTTLTGNERNVYQCLKLGGNVYLSGTGGAAYNDEKMYEENKIELVYSDYKQPIYKQTGKEFIEDLSVFDYICNEGFSLPQSWMK